MPAKRRLKKISLPASGRPLNAALDEPLSVMWLPNLAYTNHQGHTPANVESNETRMVPLCALWFRPIIRRMQLTGTARRRNR